MIVFLKNVLEQFKYFAVKLLKLILAFFRFIAFSRVSNRNIGKAESDTVIVLGNGPSLREQFEKYPDFFRNKDIICANHFPKTNEYKLLKPRSCVWLDPNFYRTKEKKDLIENVRESIDTLIRDTTWEMVLYLPNFASKRKYYKEISSLNPFIKVVFFNYTIFDTFDWINHSLYKSRMAMPRAITVVVASLYIAITRRYKTIYVAGVETDFIKNIIVDKNNDLFLEHKHFYTNEKSLSQILPPNPGFGTLTLGKYLSFIANIYKGYTELQRYAEYMKVPVINLTPGSYIDAFPKKEISEVS